MNKHTLTVLLCAILSYLPAWAISTKDSLIKFQDLPFSNERERSAFRSYLNHSDSTYSIDLFLASYFQETDISNEKAIRSINECVAQLSKETTNKPVPKRVKYVYEYVHKKFLKVYALKNSFPDIFEKGEYNCVSATALYAIIFSKLQIPYEIMESPQHVYIIAYPKADKILIETTSPEKGYYQFSEDFVKKYISNLTESKTISKLESDTSSTNELFNKYYFSSESISLVQLAGLQYNNFGLYNIETKKMEESIDHFKRSYFLYPCERNAYMLKTLLLHQVGNNNYSDLKLVNHLALLCRYKNLNDDEISNETIRNEFLRITENMLINQSEYEKYDKSYEMISESIADTLLKNDIAFTYHSELARLGLINLKDPKYEMPHLLGAYRSNPRNANLHALILGYFESQVRKNDDVMSIMDLINDFSEKFDFLKENSQFNGMKANCLLELSYQNFATNNITKGESLLKEFELLCSVNKAIEPNTSFVEKAYAVAAGVYYKNGNYTKAKQFLKTGLIYAPNNFGLKQRLSQF